MLAAADKRRDAAVSRAEKTAAELEQVRTATLAEAQARRSENERVVCELRQRVRGAEQAVRAMEARCAGELEARGETGAFANEEAYPKPAFW